MQVLTTQCPYCQRDVETTVNQLDEPVVCPSCHKPFEMRMPTATVSAVKEVAGDDPVTSSMMEEPREQTLIVAHPVVFRARPFGTLLLVLVVLAAAAGFISPLLGWEGMGADTVGPLTPLAWLCLVALLVTAAVAAFWMIQSRFTTLTVTDDRTIYQKGIVRRETSEVQHDDVRNIQIDQSFIERLLGVGSIGVSSSGQDDLEIVAYRIPDPQRIIDVIRANQ